VVHKVRDTLFPGEDVYLERLGGVGPRMVPGSDYDVTRTAGQVRIQLIGIIGVVEDEKPSPGDIAAQRIESGFGCLHDPGG